MPLMNWEAVGRNDEYYKACTGVFTAGGAIVGGATGSVLGPAGTVGGYLGGAAWGFAIGYFACPYLAPAIRRKLESGALLDDAEARNAAEAMGQYASLSQAKDAVKLVALVRPYAGRGDGAPVCTAPHARARELLRV
jgi:hypothetical protein